MALPIISNVFRLAMLWVDTSYAGAPVNVMHFQNGSGNPNGLITQFKTNALANMWAFQPSTSSIFRLDCTPLDGTGATVTNLTASPANLTGQRASTQLNPQVANIIKFSTAKRGRSYRGRIYLPYVCESVAQQGQLDTATLALCQTAWTTFMGAMVSSGYHPVVASYVHSTADDITNWLAERFVATQRRRNVRLSV